MLKFNLKIGPEAKRLRIIRDNERIEEELYRYNFRKYEKSLLINREKEEEKKARKLREEEKEKRRIEEEERAERLRELERKEKIITRYWNEFVISNEGQLLDLDLSKVTEDTVPISVAKEEIQNAYERGMEDGQMQAMSTYKVEIEKYQEWIRIIDSVANELKHEHVLAISNFEQNMIELSIMIAESILDERITEDKSVVITQVRKAIASVYNEKIFKIHVNPELVSMLEEVKSSLLDDPIQADKIEIYPNPSVPIGGCLLEASGGMLDARVKNQLRKINKELELENDRIFNTKEIEEEFNNFYNEVDEQIKQDTPDLDIEDDFSYDDMPEEYKAMFGEDIFGSEDMDLQGNILEAPIQETLPEELEQKIDYQKLLEEDEKINEYNTLKENDDFSLDENENFELNENNIEDNNEDFITEGEEDLSNIEEDIQEEFSDDDNFEDNNEFGLDDFNFDDEFNNE